jgi:hypothetical protein
MAAVAQQTRDMPRPRSYAAAHGTGSDGYPVIIRAQGSRDGDQLPLVGSATYPRRPDGGVGVWWVQDGALIAVTT